MPPKMQFDNNRNNNLEKSTDFNFEKAPTYKINIHGYWDTVSRNEIFLSQLNNLPFYRKDLLYSGFDLYKAKQSATIFCATEADLENTLSEEVNPIDYALKWGTAKTPTIGVYDPTKLQDLGLSYKYRILSQDALIALIHLYEEEEVVHTDSEE